LGEGTLTLLLPSSAAPEDPSRSVLPNVFIATLVYRLTITGPGGSRTLETSGGGTTLTLAAGNWTIQVRAYDPVDLSSPIGSGNAAVTVIAGRNSFVKVPMQVDPAYEAGLDAIYLHSEADLRRIGAVNGLDISDPNRTFYLEDDIILTQPWTPIGSPGDPFKAVFDGQDHSITVRSFSGPVLDGNAAYLGFFAFVEDASIKDTTVEYEFGGGVDMRTGAGTTYYDGYAGGVAGRAYNTSFENIQVEGDFSVEFDGMSGIRVGGIVGKADDVTITGCRITGTISGTSTNYLAIGGIAGMTNNTFPGEKISGSSFTGTITGYSPGNADVGGIVGYFQGEITACFVEGYITVDADHPSVGGIAGTVGNSNINKSYVVGKIEGPATGFQSDTGGIAGRFMDGTIENCYAWVDVSSSSVYNTVYSSGEENVGGIAGVNQGGTISKCYAMGTVKANGQNYIYVGGIAGKADTYAVISGCMALIEVLDGGSSTYTKTVYAIGRRTSGNFSENYSWDGISIINRDNSSNLGIADQDGEQKPSADFKSSVLYATAGWNFPGDWKFLPAGSGYPYPVLSWQTEPPADPATLP
jgi:hypothetical protein